MKRLIARLLIALGLGLLGLGQKLDKPAAPAAELTIDLNHRWYRPARPARRGLSFNLFIPVMGVG